MKVDAYTKTMLTIIAIALTILVFQNSIRDVEAGSNNIQKVIICDRTGYSCAKISGGALSVKPTTR